MENYMFENYKFLNWKTFSMTTDFKLFFVLKISVPGKYLQVLRTIFLKQLFKFRFEIS